MKTVSPSTIEKATIMQSPTATQARLTFILLLIINILNYTDRSIFASVQILVQKSFP